MDSEYRESLHNNSVFPILRIGVIIFTPLAWSWLWWERWVTRILHDPVQPHHVWLKNWCWNLGFSSSRCYQGKRPFGIICCWLWFQTLSRWVELLSRYTELLFYTCTFKCQIQVGTGLCKQMNLAFYTVTSNLKSLLDNPEDPLWSHSSSILLVRAQSPVCCESTWQENLSPSLKWAKMNSQPPNGPTSI